MKKNKDSILKELHYLTCEIHALYHEIAVSFHLSDSAMIILYTLCINEGKCLLQEIYQLSGTSRQTIHSAIRKLEQDQIIYLTFYDGKKKNVQLSEKGKKLSENSVLRLMELEQQVLASWSGKDQKCYLELSKCYLENMKEKTKNLQGVRL